jgi:hypothetical protein
MILIAVSVGAAQAGERSSGGFSNIQGGPPPAVQPRNPADAQYWSDACKKERDYGMTQSANCRNPAYSGGGRGYGSGYNNRSGYGRGQR